MASGVRKWPFKDKEKTRRRVEEALIEFTDGSDFENDGFYYHGYEVKRIKVYLANEICLNADNWECGWEVEEDPELFLDFETSYKILTYRGEARMRLLLHMDHFTWRGMYLAKVSTPNEFRPFTLKLYFLKPDSKDIRRLGTYMGLMIKRELSGR